MWGFVGKIAKKAAAPVGRAVVSHVGKKLFKRSNIARVITESGEAFAAIEFLRNKYADIDDDAKWAWDELTDLKTALRDLV
jgi:hypothetical protein